MSATGDESRIRYRPFGDAAVLVELGVGDAIDQGVNRRAQRLASMIDRRRAFDRRLGRPVPAYASVLVPFDPLEMDAAEAGSIVAELFGQADGGGRRADTAERHGNREGETLGNDPRLITIPVRYGGADGPDLEYVADSLGRSAANVVALHASTDYHVYMLGFAPGFAYLGPLPAELAIARRPTPRERVPAGSVAIAAGQTAVYPFETPGGWWLIGRTDEWIWDVRRDPPARLRPGDRVRFVPAR